MLTPETTAALRTVLMEVRWATGDALDVLRRPPVDAAAIAQRLGHVVELVPALTTLYDVVRAAAPRPPARVGDS